MRPRIAAEIAPRLVAARSRAQLDRDEVARMMMMAPHVLALLEKGKGIPTDEQAEALARIYGVSVAWVLFGDETKPAVAPTEVTPLFPVSLHPPGI